MTTLCIYASISCATLICLSFLARGLRGVTVTWLRQSYDVSRHGHPSWKKLVEAVASGGQNPALAQKIAAAHQGEVLSIRYLSSLDRWIVFTASRKRQRSNDEGVPQPHIEDGEETHLCISLCDGLALLNLSIDNIDCINMIAWKPLT